MTNRFFDNDSNNIPENNSESKEKKFPLNLSKKNIYEIFLAVVGIIVLVFALFQLSKSSLFHKSESKPDPSRAQESHHLQEQEEEEIDPSLIIPPNAKETLDEYCTLTDNDGMFISSKMSFNNEDIYELCDNFRCMTTIIDNDEITYYYEDCQASKNKYKKMTKKEMDVDIEFQTACANLDDEGNYSRTDVHTDTSITCQKFSCTLNYKGEKIKRSCVS